VSSSYKALIPQITYRHHHRRLNDLVVATTQLIPPIKVLTVLPTAAVLFHDSKSKGLKLTTTAITIHTFINLIILQLQLV